MSNLVIAQEQFPSGSAASAGVPSSFNQRQLNVIVTNDIDATLVNGRLTLKPGEYVAEGEAVAYRYDGAKLGLYDYTNGAWLVEDLSLACDSGTAFTQSSIKASCKGKFSLTALTDVGLAMWVGNSLPIAAPSGNLGQPVNSSRQEVYARLSIEKV